MARMKRYLGEMVSGKIGNVVFYRMNGESYVRGVPQRQKDSWTEAQQQHRTRIGQVGKLWRQLKHTQLPRIWNLGAQRTNGYALFLKANLPAFATNGSLADARELRLSTGRLSLPQDMEIQRQEVASPLIRVSWQNKTQPRGERLQDELMVVAMGAEACSEVTPTGIRRHMMGGTFECPRPASPATHIYLFFASTDRINYSDSVCFEV